MNGDRTNASAMTINPTDRTPGRLRSSAAMAAPALPTTTIRSALHLRSARYAQRRPMVKEPDAATASTRPITDALSPRSTRRRGMNGSNVASATPTNTYVQLRWRSVAVEFATGCVMKLTQGAKNAVQNDASSRPHIKIATESCDEFDVGRGALTTRRTRPRFTPPP